MPTCVPIKDMRDTAAFSELVEKSADPIIVTKNGYDQFVVIRSKDYEEMRHLQAKAQLMERLLIAERERAAGAHVDAQQTIDALRNEYAKLVTFSETTEL